MLFPNFPLQLHIFEERYKAMISECLDRDAPFGVVLIREGRDVGAPAVPHDIGCTARILGVKKLEDGRMNLLAVGESRFRLLEYSEAELPYLMGRVERLVDHAPSSDLTRRTRELQNLFRRYMRLLSECAGMQIPELELPDDPSLLGLCIAGFSQIPAFEKQRLLTMNDPQERLKVEKLLLRQQIKELQTLQEDRSESESGEEPKMSVLYAEPLNLASEFWIQYRTLARN